ncbi:MAG: hypothetical protein K9N47_03260 [Prosthecobacter sp.]|uniref:hypothetical protein n=1 Tax=Prosthecobacter sp. TaxID=1965333 RepID=UPI0025D1867E|nr:hypothetical protein [Prosthecobacter sp.]MCF7785111.1 hypothetical protein [Prosthecobacter sp.]
MLKTHKLVVFLAAVWMFVAFAEVNSSAQTAPRYSYPSQSSAQNQTLSQDVTRPFGEYRYVPQQGLYKDVTLEDSYDDLKEGVRKVGTFFSNLNFITGWSQQNPDGFSSTVMGGMGPFRLPRLGASWGSPYNNSYGGLQFRAGPVMVDNIYLTYGLLYADLQGAFPGREQLAPDDRWAQIVTLSFRLSMAIGDSIGVSIQPFLYWLPDTGEVGWGVPGPLGGFQAYQPNVMALFQIAYNKQIGNWNYTIFDIFNPLVGQYNLWDVLLSSQASFGNLSPIERVGRYSVGMGGGDLTNYNPDFRAGVNPTNWTGVKGFYNTFGMRAVGTLGDNTRALIFLNRMDYWSNHFEGLYAGVTGGAYLQKGTPNFNVYGGYSFFTGEPFNTVLNWAVVGARKQVGPTIAVYAQGGYYWYTGENKAGEGWLATVGITQRLGQRTSHYVEAGRRVFTPVTGPYGIEDYIEYRLTHMLGNRSSFNVYVGQSERNIATVGNSLTVKYAGAMLTTLITMRLSAFASSGWANVASGANAYIYDAWTHRFGLRHNLTQNIQTQAFYQYLEGRTNTNTYNYSEHFIYFGVSKRF